MVFHALGQKRAGVDIEHVTFELHEDLDADRLADAWQQVTAAHETLHCAVDTSGSSLTFSSSSSVPVAQHRWSSLDPGERSRRWRDIQESSRLRGFDVTQAPLQRLHLIELDPGHWRGLWSFHHLILDGRSFPLVLRDVFSLYDNGTPPPERPSFLRHTEAVARQDRFGDQVFWKEELDGWEPTRPIQILADSDLGSAARAQATLQVTEKRIDRATTAAIVEAASDIGVSTNALVQTAWSIVLHRYLGTDDIVFGSTRACRHVVPDADQMVGLLINTVPFRVKVDRSATVTELAQSVAATHRRLRQAETSPLHLIKQWAGVEPQAELFDSLVMFDEQTLGERLTDLGQHRHFNYDGQTNLPITLLAYADPEMLIRLETQPDALSREPSERMLEQFITVLTSMAANPRQQVGQVDYLTDRDRALVDSWNNTAVEIGSDQTLDDLLRDQARRTPNAPALSFGDQTLTYAQLRNRVDAVAASLAVRGVGAESVVGVYAKRSLDMIVAIHGIVAAGGTYLPLDPDLPSERLAFMIEDADAALVITAAAPLAADFSTAIEVVAVTDLEKPIGSQHDADSRDVATADNAAYVIYTSGSTGKPKGVVNEHRGIVNRLLWMQDTFALDADDVVLQKTPFTFDVSVWELFWPLMVGAQLHIAAPDAHRDPRHLVGEITASGTTVMHFVPSMLAVFADEPAIESCTSLRALICSGEALPRDLQDRTLNRLDVELHNLYGPTEAAIDVTWWRCDPSSPLDTVPIGAAIANTRMHVLDHDLAPVPPGAQGELFIAGVQVARGYLNRPELNAKTFLEPGTVAAEPGRLYRTGDLGRHREDGTIEYLGRTDHQVKLRGLRIELGEIESVLTNHPMVTNAAVLDRQDRPGDVYLAAYVVLDGSPGDITDELRAHLAKSLADYMIPSVFITMDEFPLSSSGKTDRKALPAPPLVESAPELPVGEVEAVVAAIWCELLGVETVDRLTPFFRAGGHSLLIIRLAHALGERFERTVEVTALIDHATVAAQAALLDGEAGAEDADRAADIAATVAKRKAAGRRRRAGQRPGAKR